MNDTIKVFVVADFEPLCAGLVRSISAEPDLTLVGSCDSINALLQDPQAVICDVLVVDVHALPATHSELDSQTREMVPGLKVLFLGSAHEEREARSLESIRGAMNLHTVGLVFKNGPAARLIQAIRLIAAGIFVCETEVMRQLLLGLSRWADSQPQVNGHGLSEREIEVLAQVARGRSNKEIADRLFLSEGTVKAHISHMMNKTGVERRTELVVYALTNGIGVTSEDGEESAVESARLSRLAFTR